MQERLMMSFKNKKQNELNYLTVDFTSVPTDVVSAEDLIDILEKCPRDIGTVRFKPPVIGQAGFGQFIVRWKTPYYRMVS